MYYTQYIFLIIDWFFGQLRVEFTSFGSGRQVYKVPAATLWQTQLTSLWTMTFTKKWPKLKLYLSSVWEHVVNWKKSRVLGAVPRSNHRWQHVALVSGWPWHSRTRLSYKVFLNLRELQLSFWSFLCKGYGSQGCRSLGRIHLFECHLVECFWSNGLMTEWTSWSKVTWPNFNFADNAKNWFLKT